MRDEKVASAKKRVSWELKLKKQQKQITRSQNQRSLRYQNGTEDIVVYLPADDCVWIAHALSDRKFKQVAENGKSIFTNPFLCVTVFDDLYPSYVIKPSLMNIKLAVDVNAEDIVYTSEEDVWSPTAKNGQSKSQQAFMDGLEHEMSVLDKLHTSHQLRLFDGSARSLRSAILSALSDCETLLGDSLVETNFSRRKTTRLPLRTLLSPQTLFSHQKKKSNPISPWNEVIIRRSDTVKIDAILISRTSLEHALSQAQKLNNSDAIAALEILTHTELPIILLDNEKSYTPEAQIATMEERLGHCGRLSCELLRDVVKLRNMDYLVKVLARYSDCTIQIIGGQALQEACYLGDLRPMEILLEKGVNPTVNESIVFKTAEYRRNSAATTLLKKYVMQQTDRRGLSAVFK